MKVLDSQKILNAFILIGGWCQRVYRYHFKNPPELSALRTADIDFMIPNPQNLKTNIDIPEVFRSLNFDEEIFMPEGHVKYVHPDLEIELLVSAKGRENTKPFPLKSINSNAQRLRHLDFIEQHTTKIKFYGIDITVPEPAAFVINKIIVSKRRTNIYKQEKDLKTAQELAEFIIKDSKQRHLMIKIFNSLSRKTQNLIAKEIKNKSFVLFELLTFNH